LQLSDLVASLFKAWIFGFIAAMVATYKGMNCETGPAGVGRAVNQAVVLTFLLIFAANYVITTLYFVLVPAHVWRRRCARRPPTSEARRRCSPVPRGAPATSSPSSAATSCSTCGCWAEWAPTSSAVCATEARSPVRSATSPWAAV